MEKDSFTKKYNFRLPDRTIEQLDEMVNSGAARNRTEAVILAVDRVYSSDITRTVDFGEYQDIVLQKLNEMLDIMHAEYKDERWEDSEGYDNESPTEEDKKD